MEPRCSTRDNHNHGHKDMNKTSITISSNAPVTTSTLLKPMPCSGGDCCLSALSDSSGTDISSDDLRAKMPIHVQAEQALPGAEHYLIRVQGMDCTGCEIKLRKSLASIEELKNIKTSFLLAQAEFDLFPSDSTNSSNILQKLNKMTGFTCSRAPESGAVLELVVSKDPQGFFEGAEENYPTGVTEIVFVDKDHIQVLYNARVVGARELLTNRYFERHDVKLGPPTPSPSIAAGRVHFLTTFYMTILSLIFTIPVLILTWGPVPVAPIRNGAASLALATVVQLLIGAQFYSRAFKAWMYYRTIDMDLLIVLSSSAAYIFSIVSFCFVIAEEPLETGTFFETSTMLLTLIMVGRTVSAFAQQKALEAITVESLQAKTAILYDPASGRTEEIDSRLLQYGDSIKIYPEMSIATDGTIVSGESEVDESMITGEATLVVKSPGMDVIAGSLNHSRCLIVEISHLPWENTIHTISALVDEAKASKPRVQALADQVARHFVPVILGIAVVVFVAWVVKGYGFTKYEGSRPKQDNTHHFVEALKFAIATLVVSCPCAIGLAVPMVVVIAGGVAAKKGVIFRSAETIDIARKVNHVVFDKTGTLTRGNLTIVEEDFLGSDKDLMASLILGLTSNSKHPISKAIATHLSARDVHPSIVRDVVSVVGKGVEAVWEDGQVRAGNPAWLGLLSHPNVKQIIDKGLTVFCITLDDKPVAIYGLADLLRPDAYHTVAELEKRSIAVSIISGDNEAAVMSVAKQLNIATSNVRAHCSPEDKRNYIKSLQEKVSCDEQTKESFHAETRKGSRKCFNTKKHNHNPRTPVVTVLFIGDGTNDAPSLAQANIGLHISEGTDVASAAADAILIRPLLYGIVTLIDISAAFHRRVLFNFAWGFVYNFAAVLLAAGAFSQWKVKIAPEFAGLGEMVSVVPVVLAGFSLRFWRK